MRLSGAVAAAVLVTTVSAERAWACGGFFCNKAQVDQTAEQIVFAREGDKSAAYIQIRYQGSVASFGWIVPVRNVPEKLELSSTQIFNDLNRLTAPTFIAPVSAASTGGGLCASSSTALAFPKAAEAGSVDVLGEGTFGKFNYAILQSTSADALFQWLQTNGYNPATDDAKAIIQQYLNEQATFVALKLEPDARISDIQPVKITFPKWDPCVPLRLTRIAAQPNMGVLVYVVGDTRATSSNYGSVTVADKDVRFRPDGFGPTNYRTLVKNAVAAAGSHAFITEFAGATDALANRGVTADTQAILGSGKYLTRLYTVISPADMTLDPDFVLSDPGKLGDVSNVHRLGDESLAARGLPTTMFLAFALMGTIRRKRARES
jgi:hypothetical protein